MPNHHDDDCDCSDCLADVDRFWREQEGEPDPDMPPDTYEFDVADLDEPPVESCPGNDACIGCGGRINHGDPTRLYEEGHVHAGGCPPSREN
jgi:hypothetical protein